MSEGTIAVKAAHALLEPADLARAIEGRFVLPPIQSVALHRSFINDTYRVEAGGRPFYLRVYQAGWRTAREAAAEMAIMTALAGGPVAQPVARRDGGFVIELATDDLVRPAVLVADAPGEELTYDGADGAANAACYGHAAAALHDAADGLAPHPDRAPIDTRSAILWPRAVVGQALVDDGDRAVLARITDRLLAAIADNAALTRGFAHGDLNSGNIHFAGDRFSVIDFDCCGWGWRANDIAAFLRGVTLRRLPGEEASALMRAYLAGYQAHRSIAPVDRAALPAFLLVQRLWMAALHLDGRDHRWGAASFGPAYVARLIDWLVAWESVLDQAPDWL